MAISPVLQLLIFDPYIYFKVYLALFGSTFVTQNLLLIRKTVYQITYAINMGYIIVAIIRLILYLIKPKIRIIRLYSTYISIGFVSFYIDVCVYVYVVAQIYAECIHGSELPVLYAHHDHGQ